MAMAQDKTQYNSKRCGEFIIISDIQASSQITVCRDDKSSENQVLDDGYKTPEATTYITVPDEIIEEVKNSSKIVDEILLKELKARATKKLEGFKYILDLPDTEETVPLKKQVAAFKNSLLDSKKGAIHQIRTILSVYDGLKDELINDHSEYKTLLCKYEVWKHKREVLEKVAKISSKIVKYLLLAGVAGTALAFFGTFSIAMMGPIIIALGATEVGVGGLQLLSSGANWDDVKAGTIAKKLLKFDSELHDYIEDLQKNPAKNELLILQLKDLELTQNQKEDFKNLKKLKKARIKELIGGGLKIVSGVGVLVGGVALQKRFSDFKSTDPAVFSNGTGGAPGGTGNDGDGDGDGGFYIDDGG